MTDDGQMGMWVWIGSMLGGILTGVGSVLGINKVRGKSGEDNVSELELLKRQVSALEVSAGQAQVFQDTVNQIHDSLKRLHQRMDELDKKVARLEGYEDGRRSRERIRGEG